MTVRMNSLIRGFTNCVIGRGTCYWLPRAWVLLAYSAALSISLMVRKLHPISACFLILQANKWELLTNNTERPLSTRIMDLWSEGSTASDSKTTSLTAKSKQAPSSSNQLWIRYILVIFLWKQGKLSWRSTRYTRYPLSDLFSCFDGSLVPPWRFTVASIFSLIHLFDRSLAKLDVTEL